MNFELTLSNSLNLSEPQLRCKIWPLLSARFRSSLDMGQVQAYSLVWSFSYGKRAAGTWVKELLSRELEKVCRWRTGSCWEVGTALFSWGDQQTQDSPAQRCGALQVLGYVHLVVWEKRALKKMQDKSPGYPEWLLPAREILAASCKSRVSLLP